MKQWELIDPYGVSHIVQYTEPLSGHDDEGWYGFENVGRWYFNPEILIVTLINRIRNSEKEGVFEGFVWQQK